MPIDYIGSLAVVSKPRYIWPLQAHPSKEDYGISDSEIFEEAVYSLLSELHSNNYDDEFYCKLLASRIINNQVLHELVTSSPIIASYDKFPRLEDIQNEALFLSSDPNISSKYVKFLVSELQSEIPKYVKGIINKLTSIDTTSILDHFLSKLNYVNSRSRSHLRKKAKKEKEIDEQEVNGRGRS